MNVDREGVTVRQLSPNDFQIWKEIRLEGVKNHPTSFDGSYEEESLKSDEQWRSALTVSCIYGAFIRDKIVGCLGYSSYEEEKKRHIANVFGVYIRPEARGKSVGKVLFDYLSKHCQKEVLQLHLSVLTTNYAAINLYLKFGFVISGTYPRNLKLGDAFYDEYLMVKFMQERVEAKTPVRGKL